jgi:YVTN family beta-propeller protein
VIDGPTDKVIKTISVGSNPVGVAINPSTGRVYVVNAGSRTVSVIDGSFDGVISTILVGANPLGVAVNPRTSRVYVANSLSNTVSVIDAQTNTLVETVEVGKYPNWVALNPGSNKVYVSNGESATISIMNGTSNNLLATVPVGINPLGMEFDPNRNRLYVANGGSASVSVIDGTRDNVVTTFAVGSGPSGVAFNANTNKVYVANALSNTVSVISEIPFEFTFSLSPSSATVEVGKATTFTVTIIPTSGSARAMNLSVAGLPQGMSANFAPRTGNPPFASMLTITTSTLTSPGTYSITINALTSLGTKTSSIILTVTALDNTPMDFSLSSNPLSISIMQREQATYTITLSLLRGKGEPVALSVVGLPADSTAEFSPTTISSTSSVQLKIVTQSTTPAGVYQMSVVGHTQGGLTRSTNLFLTVRAPAPPPPQVGRQPFDFSISIVPTETRLDVGATVVLAVNVTLISGNPDAVNLRVASAYPNGVTFSFAPQKEIPSFVSVMKITAASTTAPGAYPMTVTAVNNGVTRSSTFNLNITKGAPKEVVREVVKDVPIDVIKEVVRGVLQENQKPTSNEEIVPISLVLMGAGITALAVSVLVAAWIFTSRKKRPTEITV